MNDINKMPSMPDMEESVKASLPGEQDLPIIADENTNNNSVTSVPKAPKKGIEVTATLPGFYRQRRLAVGQVFTVKKKEHLGSWMKCTDKAQERERAQFFKNKKAKK